MNYTFFHIPRKEFTTTCHLDFESGADMYWQNDMAWRERISQEKRANTPVVRSASKRVDTEPLSPVSTLEGPRSPSDNRSGSARAAWRPASARAFGSYDSSRSAKDYYQANRGNERSHGVRPASPRVEDDRYSEDFFDREEPATPTRFNRPAGKLERLTIPGGGGPEGDEMHSPTQETDLALIGSIRTLEKKLEKERRRRKELEAKYEGKGRGAARPSSAGPRPRPQGLYSTNSSVASYDSRRDPYESYHQDRNDRFDKYKRNPAEVEDYRAQRPLRDDYGRYNKTDYEQRQTAVRQLQLRSPSSKFSNWQDNNVQRLAP